MKSCVCEFQKNSKRVDKYLGYLESDNLTAMISRCECQVTKANVDGKRFKSNNGCCNGRTNSMKNLKEEEMEEEKEKKG